MKKIATLFIAVFLAVCACENALAWGKIGHRVVAQLAYKQLSGRAQKNLAYMVPSCASFVDFATFLDDIKSDSIQPYHDMSVWHFVTLDEDSLSFDEFIRRVKLDSNQNAYKTILMAVDSLKKNPQHVFWLKVLIHVVGDIFQPLHIGRGLDHGGNLLKVNWSGSSTNLHAVWADKMIDFWEYSATELATLIHTRPTKNSGFSSVENWCYDSYRKRRIVYHSFRLIDSDQKEPYGDLRYFAYANYYKPMLFDQLEVAGNSLAQLLNTIYGY